MGIVVGIYIGEPFDRRGHLGQLAKLQRVRIEVPVELAGKDGIVGETINSSLIL